jgi:hypothetical protein
MQLREQGSLSGRNLLWSHAWRVNDLNIRGEAASAVICLDRYPMARKGRAGPDLGIAAFVSSIGLSLCLGSTLGK